MEHAAPALDAFYHDVRTEWFERIDSELWEFGNELNRWLHELFNSQSTEWREEFEAFVAEQASLGRILTPEGEEQLLAFLNDWETRRTANSGGAKQGFAKMSDLSDSWPALSEEDRERTRDSYGLPGWYAKPLEWGDGEWEKAFEELGRKSRDHMLAVCRQLELLGQQAKRSEQADEDGTEDLERLKQSIQVAHDKYVLSLVELQQNWLLYIQEHWFIGLQIQKLMDRLDADLPPRLFDLTSTHSKTLASTTHEVGKTLGEVVDRLNKAHTTAVWTERAITAIEIATTVGAIRVGAMKVLAAAVEKGIAIQIAKRMAVKYAIKQLAVQSVAYATAGYVVPPLLAASGLNRDFVFTGLMIVQSLGMIHAVRSAKTAGKNIPGGQSSPGQILDNSFEPHPGSIRSNLSKVETDDHGILGAAVDQATRAPISKPRGVWEKGPALRGEIIEKKLGQNLPQTFDTFDKFVDGVATSIKSLDLWAETYRKASAIFRKGKDYVDTVAQFRFARRGSVTIHEAQIRQRQLEIAIPPGGTPSQHAAIEAIVTYGRERGVVVLIVEVAE
jgi:hypothetical protein